MDINDILNIQKNELDFDSKNVAKKLIKISVNTRGTKKFITFIKGLDEDLNFKKILTALKKTYNCNGSILKDKEELNIIQLNGDHKKNVFEFLIANELATEDDIILSGL